jgi:4-diphosphocytidyl-2-C-methyl-D-erythritol kinase
MGGVGERLDPAPSLPPCGLVLVNPGVAVSTASVFRARHAPFSAPAELPAGWPDAAAMAAGLSTLSNDLEAPAVALCPIIAGTLNALRAHPTCLLARMSGSGATCFGLFPDPATAERAAAQLARPGWWSWGGAVRQE